MRSGECSGWWTCGMLCLAKIAYTRCTEWVKCVVTEQIATHKTHAIMVFPSEECPINGAERHGCISLLFNSVKHTQYIYSPWCRIKQLTVSTHFFNSWDAGCFPLRKLNRCFMVKTVDPRFSACYDRFDCYRHNLGNLVRLKSGSWFGQQKAVWAQTCQTRVSLTYLQQ